MTCLSSTNNSGENEGFLKTGGLKKVINFEDILKSAWKSNLNFFTVSQEQLGFQENLFLTPYRLYLHGICSIFYAPFVKLLSPSHTLWVGGQEKMFKGGWGEIITHTLFKSLIFIIIDFDYTKILFFFPFR